MTDIHIEHKDCQLREYEVLKRYKQLLADRKNVSPFTTRDVDRYSL